MWVPDRLAHHPNSPSCSKFVQTGILRDRGCRHIQSARVVLCPLHRGHDLGAPRKHVLHPEHRTTRREIVLRASAARLCGGRIPTRGASCYGRTGYGDSSAALEQCWSGAPALGQRWWSGATTLGQRWSGAHDCSFFERASATWEACCVYANMTTIKLRDTLETL